MWLPKRLHINLFVQECLQLGARVLHITFDGVVDMLFYGGQVSLLDFVGVDGISHYQQCFEFNFLTQRLQCEPNLLSFLIA